MTWNEKTYLLCFALNTPFFKHFPKTFQSPFPTALKADLLNSLSESLSSPSDKSLGMLSVAEQSLPDRDLTVALPFFSSHTTKTPTDLRKPNKPTPGIRNQLQITWEWFTPRKINRGEANFVWVCVQPWLLHWLRFSVSACAKKTPNKSKSTGSSEILSVKEERSSGLKWRLIVKCIFWDLWTSDGSD